MPVNKLLSAGNVPCLFYKNHFSAALSLAFPAPKLNLLKVRGQLSLYLSLVSEEVVEMEVLHFSNRIISISRETLFLKNYSQLEGCLHDKNVCFLFIIVKWQISAEITSCFFYYDKKIKRFADEGRAIKRKADFQ